MTIALVLGAASDYPAASALVSGARERNVPITIIAAGLPADVDPALVDPIDVQVLLGDGSPVLRESLALMGLEREVLELDPSAIVVFAAHEASLAAALIAAKQRIPLWHAGAGRWAFQAMEPDEVGNPPGDEDLISIFAAGLLAPTEFAATSLAAARYDVQRIWVTGPLEAETLERASDQLSNRAAAAARGLRYRGYVAACIEHPGLLPQQPLPIVDVRGFPYLERVQLLTDAAVVVTDGFSLQLEACLQRVPCLVVAPGSPIREARAAGAAKRVPADPDLIGLAIAEQADRSDRDWETPEMFDGDVSARILALISPAPVPAS